MYYFAFITSDYLQKAELALRSFFHYNGTILNLFVIDSGYNAVCKYYEHSSLRSKLNIINAYSKEFHDRIRSYNYGHSYLPASTANITLSSFRVLDLIPENECVRVDLDAIYLSALDFLNNYKTSLAGMKEDDTEYNKFNGYHQPNHTAKPIINVGVAKYTKDRFKLNNSFTDEMFKRIDADWNNYLIPEQDIYNELASDRIAISESIVSPCSVENDTNLTDVKAIHYNGLMKPWVDNSSIALDHFPITASYLLCEVFAKKYNYFPDTINKISSIFKHSLWQRNLSAIQQNYVNKLIKLRSEVSNW